MDNLDRLDEVLKRKSWVRFPYYFVRYFLTANGKIFLACTMLSAPISFVALNTTAHMFFTAILSLMIFAFIFNFLYKPKVEVKTVIPSLIEAKSIVNVDIHLKNKTKRTFYQVKAFNNFWSPFISHQESKEISIFKPLEEKIYTAKLKFEKRGIYITDYINVSSSFPFNLFNFSSKIRHSSKVTVFPHYQRLELFDLEINRKFQPGGISLVSNIGESTEFMGTREYVHGDNPRFIHPQSWARTGKPVIKEFQEEYFVRFALIIDTFCDKSDRFENSLSFAASISDYLSRSDYVIDIFSAGNDFYHFQSGRALANFENILELLACLEPVNLKKEKISDGFAQTIHNIEKYIYNISSIIFIFNDWDKERENFVNLILTYGVGIKAYVFSAKKNIVISDEFKEYVTVYESIS